MLVHVCIRVYECMHACVCVHTWLHVCMQEYVHVLSCVQRNSIAQAYFPHTHHRYYSFECKHRSHCSSDSCEHHNSPTHCWNVGDPHNTHHKKEKTAIHSEE